MYRITNKKVRTEILESLQQLRKECPEIDWDNPKGELVEGFMRRAITLNYPAVLCIPSTYSTVKGISLQMDNISSTGLLEHFQISTFGLSMRTYVKEDLK